MSYESPIELFHTEPIIERIVDEYNQYIYKAVTDLDVKVDKEELEKALAYDRDQYWKGFQDGRVYTPPNPTNADRIRAMSDGELAEVISTYPECYLCEIYLTDCEGWAADCNGKLLKWLKQEATDDKG